MAVIFETSSIKISMMSAGCAVEQPMMTSSSGFWDSSPDAASKELSKSNGSQFLYITNNCLRNIWKAVCLSAKKVKQDSVNMMYHRVEF